MARPGEDAGIAAVARLIDHQHMAQRAGDAAQLDHAVRTAAERGGVDGARRHAFHVAGDRAGHGQRAVLHHGRRGQVATQIPATFIVDAGRVGRPLRPHRTARLVEEGLRARVRLEHGAAGIGHVAGANASFRGEAGGLRHGQLRVGVRPVDRTEAVGAGHDHAALLDREVRDREAARLAGQRQYRVTLLDHRRLRAADRAGIGTVMRLDHREVVGRAQLDVAARARQRAGVERRRGRQAAGVLDIVAQHRQRRGRLDHPLVEQRPRLIARARHQQRDAAGFVVQLTRNQHGAGIVERAGIGQLPEGRARRRCDVERPAIGRGVGHRQRAIDLRLAVIGERTEARLRLIVDPDHAGLGVAGLVRDRQRAEQFQRATILQAGHAPDRLDLGDAGILEHRDFVVDADIELRKRIDRDRHRIGEGAAAPDTGRQSGCQRTARNFQRAGEVVHPDQGQRPRTGLDQVARAGEAAEIDAVTRLVDHQRVGDRPVQPAQVDLAVGIAGERRCVDGPRRRRLHVVRHRAGDQHRAVLPHHRGGQRAAQRPRAGVGDAVGGGQVAQLRQGAARNVGHLRNGRRSRQKQVTGIGDVGAVIAVGERRTAGLAYR